MRPRAKRLVWYCVRCGNQDIDPPPETPQALRECPHCEHGVQRAYLWQTPRAR
jgi:DNA-directed RNA polymerase subunit RPC12/RpoP